MHLRRGLLAGGSVVAAAAALTLGGASAASAGTHHSKVSQAAAARSALRGLKVPGTVHQHGPASGQIRGLKKVRSGNWSGYADTGTGLQQGQLQLDRAVRHVRQLHDPCRILGRHRRLLVQQRGAGRHTGAVQWRHGAILLLVGALPGQLCPAGRVLREARGQDHRLGHPERDQLYRAGHRRHPHRQQLQQDIHVLAGELCRTHRPSGSPKRHPTAAGCCRWLTSASGQPPETPWQPRASRAASPASPMTRSPWLGRTTQRPHRAPSTPPAPASASPGTTAPDARHPNSAHGAAAAAPRRRGVLRHDLCPGGRWHAFASSTVSLVPPVP